VTPRLPLPSLFAAALLVLPAPPTILAQTAAPPADLERVELERSRLCVDVLARVNQLDQSLEPVAVRSRRLSAIAEAIAIEDRTLVDPLDTGDALESLVADWFVTDAALAQRYANQPDPNLAAERAAGRESIKAAVTQGMQEVQTQANALLAEDPELATQAAPCDGAIFVRSAVEEACASSSGPVCDALAEPTSTDPAIRFVDNAAAVWDIQQLRPWTTPTPLRPGPNGQLEGARTIGFARVGNVVVSVAFAPLLRGRQNTPEADLARYAAINDSLGLSFQHPDVAFTPAMSVRAALPEPLGGESRYVLHFGEPTQADVLWSAPAGSGAALEASFPLGAANTRRLQAGEPVSLTALRGDASAAPDPVFTIQLSNAGQAPLVQGLLEYMSSRLQTDLTALTTPRGGL
jgi:hypothetical protein